MSHATFVGVKAFSFRVAIALLFAAWVLLPATYAHATALGINSSIAAGTTPGTAGGTLVFSEVQPTVAQGSSSFTGTLTTKVFSNDPANPFGAGNLTFTYLLSNDATSTDAMERFTVPGYGIANLLTDVSYSASAQGVPPTIFTRSGGLGDVIGVSYTSPNSLLPGSASDLVVVHTNATQFASSEASVIDSTTASALTVAPTGTVVPEPATLALAAAGFVSLLAIRRSRLTS